MPYTRGLSTEAYCNELTHNKEQNKRLMKGYLEKVIAKKREEFGVSDKISASAIRSCMYEGSLALTHRGYSPPLLNAELALVKICIQMRTIQQPLTCDEAIAVMNDMISETEMRESDRVSKDLYLKFKRYGRIGVN